MEVQVKVCNAGVCTITPSILIKICDENEEQRDENIDNSLSNVILFLFFILFLFGDCDFFRLRKISTKMIWTALSKHY